MRRSLTMAYQEQRLKEQNKSSIAIYATLLVSIVLTVALCFSHISGSTTLVVAVLAGYLVCLTVACIQNMTLPVLLYFLPWSALMRTSPNTFSVFTFGLVLVCAINIIKSGLRMKSYQIVAGLLLCVITLLAKLLHGYSFSFAYIAFLMMVFLFPVVMEETRERRYSFFHIVTFFSLGIIIAAVCALYFTIFSNIARFIRVDSYAQITRRCGFYGDPNFYVAQITAALAGCFVLVLKTKKKSQIAVLCGLIIFLLYCGLLSASKSFALVTAGLVLLWFLQLLILKGRMGLKVIMILVSVVTVGYIASSNMFGELLDDIVIRFSSASNLDDFTTHRTQLWASYIESIFSDVKILLLGNGLTNVKVNDRGSHSTPIQIVWQCGVIGFPVLASWSISFLKDGLTSCWTVRKQALSTAIIFCGVCLPWMAIDVLFFDEFFLMQAYLICGLCMGLNEDESR